MLGALSALLQATAGFLALIGLFAVFRLQTHREHVRQVYMSLRTWFLRNQNSSAEALALMSDRDLRETLRNTVESVMSKDFQERSRKYWNDLVQMEKDDFRFSKDAFCQTLWWVSIFGLSLLAFPLEHLSDIAMNLTVGSEC